MGKYQLDDKGRAQVTRYHEKHSKGGVAGLKQIEGIEDVKVEVTWSPAWKITRISRYGRIALGLPPR